LLDDFTLNLRLEKKTLMAEQEQKNKAEKSSHGNEAQQKQSHRPTVTRRDLYENGHLKLKNVKSLQENKKKLKKAVKKTEKELKALKDQFEKQEKKVAKRKKKYEKAKKELEELKGKIGG
jgi:chromosome segregation ATPase